MQAGSVLHLCADCAADRSFHSKVIWRSKKFESGSRDSGHAHLGFGLNSLYRRGPPSISVPNLKRIAQFVQKLLRGSQNYEIRSHNPGHADLGVVLWSQRMEAPSSMSVPNLKHVALCVQKLYGSQNFEIGSRDPGHAHLGVVRRQDPSSISLPNLKRIAHFVQKLLRGPKSRKLGHVTRPRPLKGSFYGPYAGRLRPQCLYQI